MHQWSFQEDELHRSQLSEEQLTPAGLKNYLHGIEYQLQLILFITNRAVNSKKKFCLASEAKELQYLDDVVIDYGNSITFLQAKHCSVLDSKLTKDDFLGKKKTNFFTLSCSSNQDYATPYNLTKYFDTWKRLRRSKYTKTINGEAKITRYVLFTNNKVENYEEFLESFVVVDDDFIVHKMKPSTFRFKKGPSRQIFVENITNWEGRTHRSVEDVNLFLDQFIIKIEQPDLYSLTDTILQEIKLDSNINPREFFDKLHHLMQQWLLQRNTCLLTSDDFEKFRATAMGDLQRFAFMSKTKLLEKNNDKYLNELNGLEINELLEFLKCIETNKLFAFVKGLGIEKRVYKTVQLFRSSMKLCDGDWAYLELDCISDRLSIILNGIATRFLIIDCRKHPKFLEEDMLNNLNKIFEAALRNNKKLVFLIEENENQITNLITHVYSQSINISVDALSEDQINSICFAHQDKFVNLGEKYIKFSDIITEKTSGLYDAIKDLDILLSVLEKLEERPKITSATGIPYNVYIENELVKGTPLYNLQDIIETVPSKLIVIKNADKKNLTKYLEKILNNDKVRFITDSCEKNSNNAESNVKYRLISDLTISKILEFEEILIYSGDALLDCLIEKIAYIILTVKNQSLENVIVTVSFNPENLNVPLPYKYEFKETINTSDFKTIISMHSVFSVLSAPAGLGKSSLCQKSKWDEINDLKSIKSRWTILIHLPKLHFESDDLDIMSGFTETSTGTKWLDWQLIALKNDMYKEGGVMLLLDSFDEIKEERDVIKFNKWLAKIPLQTSILVTTRPHAAYKILLPNNKNLSRNFNLYFTLTKYTEEQRKKYLIQYFEAVCLEKKLIIDESILNDIYSKFSTISCKKALNLLSIPLENYIFCETLKSQILHAIESKQTFNVETFFNQERVWNTTILYQKFVSMKLNLFFKKHLEIPAKIRESPHKFNSLSNMYAHALLNIAFKQAFEEYHKYDSTMLIKNNYSEEMIKELPDSGLVSSVDLINQEEGFYLKFTHESYQEYFAAVHVIKNIFEMKKLIKGTRYNPKYRLIYSFMAQLVSVGDDLLIPRLKRNVMSHTLEFWKSLTENGDFLGAAATQLYRDCLREFSSDQREALKKLITESNLDDSNFLLKCIENPVKNIINVNKDTFHEESTCMSVTKSSQIDKKLFDKCIDKNEIKHHLKNIFKVYSKVKELLKIMDPKQISQIFEEITEKQMMSLHSYWDVNGGFAAMALLGDGFSSKLADYFINKISFDPSGRVDPALCAIISLYDDTLVDDAKDACLKVLLCLVTHRSHIKSKDQLLSLLRKSHKTILKNFVKQLNGQLLAVNSNYYRLLNEFTILFKQPIMTFEAILWTAMEIPYALTYFDGEFKLEGDVVAPISIENSLVGNFFKRIQKSIVSNFLSNENLTGSYKLVMPDYEAMAEITMVIKNNHDKLQENFASYIDSLSALSLKNLFENLFKFDLVNEKHVDELVKIVQTAKAYDKNNSWSIEGGIETVSFTGKYFNQDLADYLFARCQHWKNNFYAVEKVLKHLHETLQKTEEKDKFYLNAKQVHDKLSLELVTWREQKLEQSRKRFKPTKSFP